MIPMLIWEARGSRSEIEGSSRNGDDAPRGDLEFHVQLDRATLKFLLRLLIRKPGLRLPFFRPLRLRGIGAQCLVVRSIVMAACLLIARAIGRPGATARRLVIALLVVACLTRASSRARMQLSQRTAALISS
jgi:hypothetical protein